MSALAKAVLAFSERGVTVHYNGRVWVPEAWFEKWLELARREAKPSAAPAVCPHGRPGECLLCRSKREGGSR